ncbi:ZIP family zinc transporter [Nonomuraea sp. PA05]|uniref:ZIP family metal transporter n=1 Tax=Nonomuraea sp. PA05 TaxID=2604466 RepID=UPI0011D57568|nr:ZIP family zinc transporter [Nonomuraea sp. PA05]TYB64822.1 ZIP family zinc transporter [Nonomuraea sp. PA05]
MIEAFLWGLLAASSLLAGAAIVAIRQPGTTTLGLVMGFGAGVLLSAVSFELIQEASELDGGGLGTAVGFFSGAIVFLAGDRIISRMGYRDRKDIAGSAQTASATAIVLGIVLDGIPESTVVGLTLLQSGTVGVAILVAVFVSNVPESVAATTGLRSGGWSWTAVFTLWAGIALVSGLAAGAGYVLLDQASPNVIATVLAFAGGAILAMLSTTMMPEAYEHANRKVGFATTIGFAAGYWVHLAQ